MSIQALIRIIINFYAVFLEFTPLYCYIYCKMNFKHIVGNNYRFLLKPLYVCKFVEVSKLMKNAYNYFINYDNVLCVRVQIVEIPISHVKVIQQ